MSDALVRYDAMCSAIAECHRVDEVAELKSKARALEVYAAQAKNFDAERRACEIRMRAERKFGELLKELARANVPNQAGTNQVTSNRATQPPQQLSPYAEALQRTGISRQTASRYQALADVPKETFEAAMRDPEKPTTTAILAKAEARRTVEEVRNPRITLPPRDSMRIRGVICDLEEGGFFGKDPEDLIGPLSGQAAADMRRLLPKCIDFFTRLNEVANHDHA